MEALLLVLGGAGPVAAAAAGAVAAGAVAAAVAAAAAAAAAAAVAAPNFHTGFVWEKELKLPVLLLLPLLLPQLHRSKTKFVSPRAE